MGNENSVRSGVKGCFLWIGVGGLVVVRGFKSSFGSGNSGCV